MVFLYSTFVCLALFFTMLVYKCKSDLTPWKRKIIIGLYGLLDVIYFVAHIIYLINMRLSLSDKSKREDVEFKFLVVSGIMFIILDICIVGSGSYLSYLMGISKAKIPFFKQKFWILFFTVTIGILFFSRGLYYILFISDIDFEYIDLENQLMDWKLQLIVVLLIFLWEIFPIILVVFLFWSIPKTGKTNLPPPFSINNPNKDSESMNEDNSLLFNNMERYDSEDENPPLLNSQRVNYGTTKFSGYSTTSKLESH